tara:strand:- start:229 stop:333 length:105 start_codon:yes stop_codon:yes gene_type:complete
VVFKEIQKREINFEIDFLKTPILVGNQKSLNKIH